MPGKIQYQNVNGDMTPIGRDYFVVHEGETKFDIQIIEVNNNQVVDYVLGKEPFTS